MNLNQIFKNILNTSFRVCHNQKELSKLTDGNKFIGDLPKLINSSIEFNGKNNIFYCDKNVIIENSIIKFNQDNSIIYLCSGLYKVNTEINHNSVLYIGKNNYFNSNITLILSEGKNIFIGNNNLFGTNIWMRNADAHLLYDIDTNKRINLSKSIYIGDHVWVGQNSYILNGLKIYSGAILGANSVIKGKIVPSNTIWVGNPAHQIKKNVFWKGDCVHSWNTANTMSSMLYEGQNEFNYEKTQNEYLDYEIIEKYLCLNNVENKFEYLNNLPNNKNRFSNKLLEH